MQAHRGAVAESVLICTRCRTTQSRYSNVPAFRCRRCGAPHHADGEPIGPPMLPITARGRVSPWYGGEYVPVVAGWYECSAPGGERAKLYWNGQFWSWLGQSVGGIHKWRGMWE